MASTTAVVVICSCDDWECLGVDCRLHGATSPKLSGIVVRVFFTETSL